MKRVSFLPVVLVGIAWLVTVAAAVMGPEDPRLPNVGIVALICFAPAVLIAFAWRSAGRYAATEPAWKRLALTWGRGLRQFLLFALVFSLPGFLLAASYGNYRIRSQVAEMLSVATAARTAVSEAAQSSGTLAGSGKGIRVNATPLVTAGVVSDDGTIVLFSDPYSAVAVLKPSLEGDAVRWRCEGYPPSLFPRTCRDQEPQ